MRGGELLEEVQRCLSCRGAELQEDELKRCRCEEVQVKSCRCEEVQVRRCRCRFRCRY